MVSGIIVAAGNGTRMGFKKQFMELCGKPLLAYSLIALQQSKTDEIIVVTGRDDIKTVEIMAKEHGITKLKCVVAGGEQRSDSVRNGLSEALGEYVLIHDGARPFVTAYEINSLIDNVKTYKAATLAYPVVDTIKQIDGDGVITATVPRDNLWAASTPQGFETKLITEAHNRCSREGAMLTDDCSAAEYCGYKVKIIPCSDMNIKITTPKDIAFAKAVLEGSEIRENR